MDWFKVYVRVAGATKHADTIEAHSIHDARMIAARKYGETSWVGKT